MADSNRTRWIGTGLMLVGAAGLWGSSRFTWITVTASDDKQGEVTRQLVGAVWSPITAAVSLAFAAALIAVFVLRKTGRRIVGVVGALIGLAALWPPLQLLFTEPDHGRAKELLTSGQASQKKNDPQTLTSWADISSTHVHYAILILGIAAALLAIVGAVLIVAKPGEDKTKTSKYDSTQTRQEAIEQDLEENSESGRVLWDAMDAGIDPTEKDHRG